ncbi:hypothetical protein VVR12_05710 [Rothia sp. LK2588]|uniref:hypothetical protein n=1 Tax=Rothia sp. LK2588 TaxID=3114369 RepID=UPI0034CD813C
MSPVQTFVPGEAMGGGRLSVDTLSLTTFAAALTEAGNSNAALAAETAPLATLVAVVLGLDPTGSGAQAATLLGELAVECGESSLIQQGLGRGVGAAALAYDEAEQIANRWLNYVSIAAPEYLYDAAEIASPEGAGPLAETDSAKTTASSYLAARLLFGAATYLDVKLNGEEFARQRAASRADAMGVGNSLREWSGIGLHGFAGAHGINRPLATDSVRVHDLSAERGAENPAARQRAERAGQLVVPESAADFAFNLDVIGQMESNLDDEHVLEGQWQERDGVYFQRVTDDSGAVVAVFAYLPGTDVDHPTSHMGSVASWSSAAAATAADPDDSLEDSTAQLQLVDAGLDELGLAGSVPVYIGGFSQGGMTAAAAGNNKRFRAKHNVQGLYIQGAPVYDDPLPTDIPVTVVRDRNDPVPRLQGRSHEKLWAKNVSVIDTDYVAASRGPSLATSAGASTPATAEPKPGVPQGVRGTHGSREYAAALAQHGEKPMSYLAPVAEDTVSLKSSVTAADGSTWSPEAQQAEAIVYTAGSTVSAGYSIVETLGDHSKDPRLQALPEIPEEFQFTAAHYEEHLGPVLREHPHATQATASAITLITGTQLPLAEHYNRRFEETAARYEYIPPAPATG